MNQSTNSLTRRSSSATAGIALLALASAALVASGKVSYTSSDPRGTLLTAQALLEHGTLALDAYPGVPLDYKIVERAGHRFYAYPPGTPLLTVPAVAVARLAGLDMARPQDDDRVQRVLSAISVAAAVVLASLLALRWLQWPLAVLLAGIFVFGTPLISTMGTALWSINAVVVLSLLALLLLSGLDSSRGAPGRAAVIGALLGAAIWCRPTALAIAGLVPLWMLATHRRSGVANVLSLSAAVVAALGLLVFLSRLAFGTWLPDYYIGARLAASDTFTTALAGHLVSPSRGLLIFAAAAALALCALVVWPRRVLRSPLAWLALAWVSAHLLIVSRFPDWWGGYSYGSRLMVDVLPGIFLLLCAAATVVRRASRGWQIAALAALIAGGTVGIWINSVEALFNQSTTRWNASPAIDAYPGYAFDWHLPQFMATRARLDARLRRHHRWLIPPLDPGVDYTASSPELEVRGWSIRFLVSEETMSGAGLLNVTLALSADRRASGELWFNDRPVAHVTVGTPEPVYYVIGIPRRRVRTIEYDVLESNVLEWHGADEDQESPVTFRGLRVQPARRSAR